jgi:hypothetical protein
MMRLRLIMGASFMSEPPAVTHSTKRMRVVAEAAARIVR